MYRYLILFLLLISEISQAQLRICTYCPAKDKCIDFVKYYKYLYENTETGTPDFSLDCIASNPNEEFCDDYAIFTAVISFDSQAGKLTRWKKLEQWDCTKDDGTGGGISGGGTRPPSDYYDGSERVGGSGEGTGGGTGGGSGSGENTGGDTEKPVNEGNCEVGTEVTSSRGEHYGETGENSYCVCEGDILICETTGKRYCSMIPSELEGSCEPVGECVETGVIKNAIHEQIQQQCYSKADSYVGTYHHDKKRCGTKGCRMDLCGCYLCRSNEKNCIEVRCVDYRPRSDVYFYFEKYYWDEIKECKHSQKGHSYWIPVEDDCMETKHAEECSSKGSNEGGEGAKPTEYEECVASPDHYWVGAPNGFGVCHAKSKSDEGEGSGGEGDPSGGGEGTPTQGTSGGGTAEGGYNCDFPPNCEGGSIECAQLRQMWETRCAVEKLEKQEGNDIELGDPFVPPSKSPFTNKTIEGTRQELFDKLLTVKEQLYINYDEIVSMSPGSCELLPNFEVNTLGQTYNFDFSAEPYCTYLTRFSELIIFFSGIFIIFSSIPRKG